MSTLFLHGGGDDEAARTETVGLFVNQVMRQPDFKVALIVAEADATERQSSLSYFSNLLTSLGPASSQIVPLAVTSKTPLTTQQLSASQPTAIFVCGGMTPYYQQSVATPDVLASYVREHDLLYFGTSAGAAIAATNAVVGGWLAKRKGVMRDVIFKGASEGVGPLTIRSGLGFIDAAIDIHASQWGTLTRLIQAVELNLVPYGFAIDENTMLQVDGPSLSVTGKGHVYEVNKHPAGGVNVRIHVAGAQFVIS